MAIFFAIVSLTIGACRKKLHPDSISNPRSTARLIEGAEADAAVGEVVVFYDVMKECEDGNPQSETYSVDSAVYLTEAAYNFYIVSINDTDLTDGMAFSIEAPLESGRFDACALSEVFYIIKDSLIALENSISYDHKQICFFDVEGSAVGNVATINVHARITAKDLAPYEPCAELVNTAASPRENAYHIGTLYNPVTGPGTYKYGQGIGDFEHRDLLVNPIVTAFVHNVNTTTTSTVNAMGAEWTLRQTFLNNYFCGGNVRSCKTPFQLTTVNYNVNGSQSVAQVVKHDYENPRGVVGCVSHDILRFFIHTSGYPSYTPNDPEPYYKHWLTVPMMNYYYGHIYGIVSSQVPSGKSLHDFNVVHDVELHQSFIGTDDYEMHFHQYDIAHCVYIDTCVAKLNLQAF